MKLEKHRSVYIALFAILACTLAITSFYLSPYCRAINELKKLSAVSLIQTTEEDDTNAQLVALERQAARDPEGSIVRAQLAHLYFTVGRNTNNSSQISKAEELANESLRLMPDDNLLPLEVHARIASHRHNFARAIELSRQLIAAGRASLYETLGAALLAQGDLRLARNVAKSFVQAQPGLGSFILLGLTQEGMGERVQAEQSYKTALLHDFESSLDGALWARCILARFYIRSSRYKEAQIPIDAVLKVKPNHVFATSLEGERLLSMGEPLRAIIQFQRAFDHSRDTHFLYRLAVAYKAATLSREFKESINLVISLLENELAHGSTDHKAGLGVALLERNNDQNDLTKAIDILTLESRGRRSPEVLIPLARAYQLAGQRLEAQQTLQTLTGDGYRSAGGGELTIEPSDPPALF